MGLSTSIHFYVEKSPPDPRKALSDILAWLKPKHIQITRNLSMDNSWHDYKTENAQYNVDYEILMQLVNPEEAVDLYLPERRYSLSIESPIADALIEMVHKQIPESIRGEHWPQNLDVSVNPHDVFEDCEDTSGHFFARTFFSLRFWGYRTPNQLAEYRRLVWMLPVFIEIQDNLCRILGLVECKIYTRL